MIKKGILFAGQGQQFLFMGHDLVEKYDVADKIYKKAHDILGYDVLNLNEDELNETQYTQPAIFVLNYALSRILDIKVDVVAGLSLGEYSALVYAGVLRFDEALYIVKERAELMQNAYEPNETGMMALLKTDFETVESAISDLDVEISNYNTPNQIVIGGKIDDLKSAKKVLRKRGIRLAVMLNVSSVSHTSLMKETSMQLKEVLKRYDFKTPQIDFINNVGAKIQTDHFVDSLSRQISEMTRMAETIQKMLDMGVSEIIELGPKGSLSKFVKSIDPDISTINIYDVEGINQWKSEM